MRELITSTTVLHEISKWSIFTSCSILNTYYIFFLFQNFEQTVSNVLLKPKPKPAPPPSAESNNGSNNTTNESSGDGKKDHQQDASQENMDVE